MKTLLFLIAVILFSCNDAGEYSNDGKFEPARNNEIAEVSKTDTTYKVK